MWGDLQRNLFLWHLDVSGKVGKSCEATDHVSHLNPSSKLYSSKLLSELLSESIIF